MNRHTRALTYSRRERLHFKLFRRWPQSVVDRRLAAVYADESGLSEAVRRAGWEWAGR